MFDDLQLSFLFLLDNHVSYCFNPIFKMYFTHSRGSLPVTSHFYCLDIFHTKRFVAAGDIFRGIHDLMIEPQKVSTSMSYGPHTPDVDIGFTCGCVERRTHPQV